MSALPPHPAASPADPPPASVADLLRTCVECGLCLPHCATFLVTGNEVQSPRGRLLLLGAVQDDPDTARDPEVLRAFDLCLGCRACETACPSGVPFTLLAEGQALAAAAGATVSPRGSGWLDRPWVLRLVRGVARGLRGVARRLGGEQWRRRFAAAPLGVGRLARLIGSLPRSPDADRALLVFIDALSATARRPDDHRDPVDIAGAGVSPGGPSSAGPPVVFFTGCANEALLPGTSRRLRRLLRACGCEVTVPVHQECCGALAAHAARPRRAQDLQRRNLLALQPLLDHHAVVVAEAAGCGLELKGYPEPLGGRVRDAVELLAELELPPLAPVPLRVAIHDPCHARHGQGLVDEPRSLLRRIPGLTIVEPDEAEVCCGSGGPYALRHPQLSEAMGRRKAACLAATGADLVVTTNPGCLGQIADSLALTAPDLPVLPLSDLIWYAWFRSRGRY